MADNLANDGLPANWWKGKLRLLPQQASAEPIPIRFFTAVIKVDAIARRYPGGLSAFDAASPADAAHPTLRSIAAMSLDDMGGVVEQLEASGLALWEDIAIGDMMHGELVACPGVVFSNEGDEFMPQWVARAS